MLSIWAPGGIPEVNAGDDLVALVLEACAREGTSLESGDIVIVTSKIVSKAEGRVRPQIEREAAFAEETVRVVAARDRGGSLTRIVENRLGIVGAAAGIDASNTAPGTVLLLSLDPDASARALAAALRAATGQQVGVILSDTLGRPWRDGQTDVAIGAAGIQVFDELATSDHFLPWRPPTADGAGATPRSRSASAQVRRSTRSRRAVRARGLHSTSVSPACVRHSGSSARSGRAIR